MRLNIWGWSEINHANVAEMTFFRLFFVEIGKGQLISKCPFGVIVWTKIPTKNLTNFCPSI